MSELLARGQSDEERYQILLAREKAKRRGKVLGRVRASIAANLLTAWARITEDECGIPLEPGQITGELQEDK